MMKNSPFYFFTIGLLWITLVGGSFLATYISAKDKQHAITLESAKSFFELIVLTRAWNAKHGGVYVPITEETQPNPYLQDPLRDIEVNQNLTLTKINPSFMTRQISELATQRDNIKVHLTAPNPIRPGNRASAQEEKALKAFEKGTKETSEILETEKGSYFFYMAPLRTEKACLRCHGNQGLKEGDAMGGISIVMPYDQKIPIIPLVVGHLLIGFFGLLGILILGTKLSRAYATIMKQTVIDSLTGIANRRSFSERIDEEFSRNRREKKNLSVIMADIDNFKAYNDTYGHAKGDKCLRKIAQTIEKTLQRPGDFCARYGGEEFVIILPDTKLSDAMHVAENIRTNMINMGIPHKRNPPALLVSISLGVATTDNAPASYEELLKEADEALYAAKANGRNRVETFAYDQESAHKSTL